MNRSNALNRTMSTPARPDASRGHADDGDDTDPRQPQLMIFAPSAARGLLDDIGFDVRDGAEALHPVKLLQQLLLMDRISVRVDRNGLLSGNRRSQGENNESCAHDVPQSYAMDHHGSLLYTLVGRRRQQQRLMLLT
jgi:hypothetical protein